MRGLQLSLRLAPLLMATGLVLAACTAPAAPGGSGDPAVGTRVDARYIWDFYPSLNAGGKYAYVSVEKKGQIEKSTRIEAEVLETSVDRAKVRLTIAGASATVVDINRATPPGMPASGIVFEGRERLLVPAGSFNAHKFSYSQNGSSFNAWGERDVGILKVLEQKPNGDTVTTSLHSFQK